MTSNELSEELQRLDRQWEEITTIPETPRSLLNVIEYSLDTQQKAEVYANRLLAYFLDPSEPHGLDAELLRAFLNALPEDLEFEEDAYDLSGVQVESEVQITDDDVDREGYADLVLQQPGEWFLLIELKFYAGENNLQGEKDPQTVFYEDASHLGGRPMADYEAGQYYLYLHPEGADEAASEEFTNWTWAGLVETVLQQMVAENASRYPQRTVAQLREFIDDITNLTGMTERQQSDQEKIELYVDHHDAIQDVSNTFQKHWDQLNNEWATRLAQTLEERPPARGEELAFETQSYTRYGEVEQPDTDQWALVQATHPTETEDPVHWVFRAKDNDWAHLFKEDWWKSTDGLENLYARDENKDDIRISFIHRFSNHELAAGDQTLKLHFRNCGSNDKAFRDQFNDRFAAHKDDIQKELPERAELTGERRNKITATYPIPTTEYDTFSEAYIAALETGFIDFTVENPELIDTIDQIFEDATAVYDSE